MAFKKGTYEYEREMAIQAMRLAYQQVERAISRIEDFTQYPTDSGHETVLPSAQKALEAAELAIKQEAVFLQKHSDRQLDVIMKKNMRPDLEKLVKNLKTSIALRALAGAKTALHFVTDSQERWHMTPARRKSGVKQMNKALQEVQAALQNLQNAETSEAALLKAAQKELQRWIAVDEDYPEKILPAVLVSLREKFSPGQVKAIQLAYKDVQSRRNKEQGSTGLDEMLVNFVELFGFQKTQTLPGGRTEKNIYEAFDDSVPAFCPSTLLSYTVTANGIDSKQVKQIALCKLMLTEMDAQKMDTCLVGTRSIKYSDIQKAERALMPEVVELPPNARSPFGPLDKKVQRQLSTAELSRDVAPEWLEKEARRNKKKRGPGSSSC